MGHLKGDTAQTDVRIPKSAKDSVIADAWKSQHGVMDKPDTDDSETDPVGMPGCNGDGFTMYEEYRGFMENGKHVEGNPNSKDLFIVNLTGAEGESGMWLFSELTGLAIHKDLRGDEIKIDFKNPGDAGLRIMNENSDPARHVTFQHAVVMTYCPGDGGRTLVDMAMAGYHQRPGTSWGICLERNTPYSSYTRQGTRTILDSIFQFDKTVAHELNHTVGVEHHGENDPSAKFELLFPDDPRNTLGTATFLKIPPLTEQPKTGNELVTLLNEAGEDVASLAYTQIQATVEKLKQVLLSGQYSKLPGVEAVMRNYIDDPKLLAKEVSPDGMIGLPGGQHSGDDGCIQRYHFARFYPAIGRDKTYYLVTPGTEPLGLGMCESPQGTGVNDPNRKPQPRYFDAAPGRGACKSWVCVSDAVPGGKS